jgi:hypothetical protein
MKHTFSVISAIPGSQGNASTVEFKNISYGITVWAHHLTEMREEHNLGPCPPLQLTKDEAFNFNL